MYLKHEWQSIQSSRSNSLGLRVKFSPKSSIFNCLSEASLLDPDCWRSLSDFGPTKDLPSHLSELSDSESLLTLLSDTLDVPL